MSNVRSDSESTTRANGGDQGIAPSDRILEAVGALERLGSRASAGGSNVVETLASSVGGVARRAIAVAGETARAAIDQWAETSAAATRHVHQGVSTVIENGAEITQQAIEAARETLERLLEATGNIVEATVRLAERSSIRFLDAVCEVTAAFASERRSATPDDPSPRSANAVLDVAR